VGGFKMWVWSIELEVVSRREEREARVVVFSSWLQGK